MGWGPNAAKRRRHQCTGWDSRLSDLLALSVPKVARALDGLTDAQLVALANLEIMGDCRKGVAEAIKIEQGVRALSEGE